MVNNPHEVKQIKRKDNPKAYVLKRDGRKEEVHVDKITSRITKLCYGLNMDFVDPLSITLRVISGLYPGVTTSELDILSAEVAAKKSIDHHDYATLAARIAVSNLHKETIKEFSEVIDTLYNMKEETRRKTPLISEKVYRIIMKNADRLNSCIIYDRDFSYNYIGFKTLERSYLLKINGKIVERPQHMLMRVAVAIHEDDIDAAIETYNLLSEKYFIHASATLFSAGSPKPQLASSFLMMMPDDSIDGIFTCLAKCGYISKFTGGIGINVHNIRAKGTYIAGTNGVSTGVAPMLRVFNEATGYLIQGGSKRHADFAVYLEPWHADIFEYLELKKSIGKDELRARDLFYALWVPDLFMHRVESDGVWSLMCPHLSPELSDCWGEEFEELYEKYESEKRYVRQVSARKLWEAITSCQMDTGIPYMLYKDTCNRKSNQQNLGTIKGSGFSAEIIEYTSPDEIAECSLASVAVNMFVKADRKSYDFQKLKEVTKVVTRNLNKIIDFNYYPIPETEASTMHHRPIGIGVQGLADAFMLLRLPFDSEEASLLNKQIFETIYYGALEASCEIAERKGPYSSYEGSPVSKGILQYDMWNVTPTNLWDWTALKEKIAKHGVRNSLVLAQMPTSSTAKILGNNESIDPYISNICTRRVLSGEVQIVNQHLLRDLVERGLWDDAMKNHIINNYGSIQDIPGIPDDLKKIYKTVWEMSQKVILNMAADRGAFIDQSQSLNIHIAKPSYSALTSMHFYGWRKGLKTGMYYLKSNPGAKHIQFTADKSKVAAKSGGNASFNSGML